jgi:hypothetical protein
MKTIYYYQSFVGLDKLIPKPNDIDVIIVSSIHFDQNNIYLNDNLPSDPIFNELWKQTNILSKEGVTIMLMMGGAGGAYQSLFQNFSVYYPLLIHLIKQKNIQGIDIDIEEMVDINHVRMLIKHLVNDLGTNFIITMAPVGNSLIQDGPGMGGFSYKTLYQSDVGKYIHWFNAQCYGGTFSYGTYKQMIDNGYPPEKVGMGMMSGDFTNKTFPNALQEVKKIINDYPQMCSVDDWEYFDAPPLGKKDPSQWATLFKQN